MTKAEARRWAHDAAAGLLTADWQSCDWAEKDGPDGDRIDAAFKEIIDYHSRRGPVLGDREPRIAAGSEGDRR